MTNYHAQHEVDYSVVIPTSNHPELLDRCLAALTCVSAPKGRWEVLVIDNSEDRFKEDTAQAVASFSDDRFRYVPMEPLGLMAARHLGVKMANGRIVSFIDDDAFVAESWLQGIERSFADPNVVLVGGPNRPEYQMTCPDWVDYLWTSTERGRWLGYLSLLDFGEEEHDMDPTFVWGCNYSIRKDIFYAVGGSNPDYLPPRWKAYQGDGEVALSVKVGALGYKARYNPQCAIRHLVPASRLTLDYLGKRALFVGLHGSFTRIRHEHGLGPEQGVSVMPTASYARFTNQILMYASKIRKKVSEFVSGCPEVPQEVIEVKQHLAKCYDDGWAFHQEAVTADPNLLEYVLRPNYLGENAKIPESY